MKKAEDSSVRGILKADAGKSNRIFVAILINSLI